MKTVIKKNKIKTSPSRKIFQVFNYLLMGLITFICIYPFWYIVIYTLSDSNAAAVNPPIFLPRGFSLAVSYTHLTLPTIA